MSGIDCYHLYRKPPVGPLVMLRWNAISQIFDLQKRPFPKFFRVAFVEKLPLPQLIGRQIFWENWGKISLLIKFLRKF